MRRKQHGIAVPAQVLHDGQDGKLIAVIERGRRLVHQQDLRLLRKRAGNVHKLLFAAGQRIERAIRKLPDPEPVKGFPCRPFLRPARRTERGQRVRRAHQHRVAHGEAERHPVRLRDIGDAVRALARGERACVRPVDHDRAGIALLFAQDAAEQGRFADAVRSEDRKQLAGRGVECDARKHRRFLICKAEIANGKTHSVFSFRSKSQMKNGAPITAVRMPIGISVASRFLETSSTSSRNAAPVSMEHGRSPR